MPYDHMVWSARHPMGQMDSIVTPARRSLSATDSPSMPTGNVLIGLSMDYQSLISAGSRT